MSDITDQDKPLNAYDLKVVGDYVATLKYPSPNKTTMTEKPRELELIDNFYNFVDRISEALNTLLIDQLGEDANWDNHVGISELPYKFLTLFSHRSEAQKLFSELWELREESNGFCASLDEYKPHEWAEEQHEKALRCDLLMANSREAEERYDQAKTMTMEAANSLRVTQSNYDNYKKSSEQEFRCLKAEIITSLRAIDLCILASLCTEKQHLTHRQRNFRMRHVHQIITNEVDRFGDRRLTNYEDDF